MCVIRNNSANITNNMDITAIVITIISIGDPSFYHAHHSSDKSTQLLFDGALILTVPPDTEEMVIAVATAVPDKAVRLVTPFAAYLLKIY